MCTFKYAFEIDALFIELAAEFAGVDPAVFLAVADENDGRFLFGEIEFLGRLQHALSKWCLADRPQCIHSAHEAPAIGFGDVDQHLDVRAVILAAVAVSHQAEIGSFIERRKQIRNRAAGNVHLGFAVDTAGHAAG